MRITNKDFQDTYRVHILENEFCAKNFDCEDEDLNDLFFTKLLHTKKLRFP